MHCMNVTRLQLEELESEHKKHKTAINNDSGKEQIFSPRKVLITNVLQ